MHLTDGLSTATRYFSDGRSACIQNIPREIFHIQLRQFALIGLSSIITAIPWILTNVEKSASFPNICYLAGNPASAACDATMVSNGLQYFVFVAQTINGFAACCLYTLVPSYIETNSEKTAGGKNLAYFLASGPLGVAVGFIA